MDNLDTNMDNINLHTNVGILVRGTRTHHAEMGIGGRKQEIRVTFNRGEALIYGTVQQPMSQRMLPDTFRRTMHFLLILTRYVYLMTMLRLLEAKRS